MRSKGCNGKYDKHFPTHFHVILHGLPLGINLPCQQTNSNLKHDLKSFSSSTTSTPAQSSFPTHSLTPLLSMQILPESISYFHLILLGSFVDNRGKAFVPSTCWSFTCLLRVPRARFISSMLRHFTVKGSFQYTSWEKAEPKKKKKQWS